LLFIVVLLLPYRVLEMRRFEYKLYTHIQHAHSRTAVRETRRIKITVTVLLIGQLKNKEPIELGDL
jgi:hypothetical protein